MGQFSLAKLFGMTIRESATDGSDFTNPDADFRRLFLGEDGGLHLKDSAGTVTDVAGASGAMATDSLWDAAGDLAQGTGANTGAKLSAGTAGYFLKAGGAATANAWAARELDYVEKTSDTNITATVEASADTVVTANAIAFDGSTVVMVEFFAVSVDHKAATAGTEYTVLYLFDGSTSLGSIGAVLGGGNMTGYIRPPVFVSRRLTPSNASHTYSIRAICSNATGHVYAGAGGSGNTNPCYIRITRAI